MLIDKPSLNPALAPYLNAFTALSYSRTVTVTGPGFIPLAEILAWCELTCIDDPDEREDLIHLVREMDREYLTIHYEKHGDDDRTG